MAILQPTETLERHIKQNGVRPGLQKLAQFKAALSLRGTPFLYSQDEKGEDAIAHVKIFDPCGRWTWYLTEWDGADEAFGLVGGDCCSLDISHCLIGISPWGTWHRDGNRCLFQTQSSAGDPKGGVA
jgi:hypothetical protein